MKTKQPPASARHTNMKWIAILTVATLLVAPLSPIHAAVAKRVEANPVVEISFESEKTYENPFRAIELDVLVTQPDGKRLRVPAFWAGGNRWCFRYASNGLGVHTFRTECSDAANLRLHGIEGTIEVLAYGGDNSLYRHGPIRVAKDRRHLEHADGTPFFWLGDTWWKGLCKRIPFEGFQKLAADRKAKGFTVVQIVAGPYPDEPPFDPRWENEGGMPYEKDYVRVNPAYFAHADRRIEALIDAGIVPAIVGGWGWHMPSIGVETMNRHWRYLIARYGAYPVVWIVGGEAGGPQWTEVARYVRVTDPYGRARTAHPYSSGRQSLGDDAVLDFDMLQTGHGGGWGAACGDWGGAAANTVAKVTSHYSKTPPMPVLVGEVVYEGHMMTNGPEIQRFMFWSSMLNGAAGHTYGAGGIWQMNSETERGAEYEFTPWFEAMELPGSTQLGMAKKLLEEYPWWRFEPHPEWIEPHSTSLFEPHEQWYDDNKEFTAAGGKWDLPYAAGIPGEIRIIYIPGHYYHWSAPAVKKLERDVPYHVFLFNPASGKRYNVGTIISAGPPPKPFEGHAQPLLFEDRFDGSDSSAWKDYGTETKRTGGRLIGGKGMVTMLEKVEDTDVMASADAKSNAEAGIILRFHDVDNYLVALYSPSLKEIYVHDRKNGQWGEPLGKVAVPEIGPEIHLTAAACGTHAALVMTDGVKSFHTPIVEVGNARPGKVGLWFFQIGERQEYDNFELSRAKFAPVKPEITALTAHHGTRRSDEFPLIMHENPNVVPAVIIPETTLLPTDEYQLPRLPAPQDWVLVLERVKP
jgi:hypothetical protein